MMFNGFVFSNVSVLLPNVKNEGVYILSILSGNDEVLFFIPPYPLYIICDEVKLLVRYDVLGQIIQDSYIGIVIEVYSDGSTKTIYKNKLSPN